MMSNRQVEEIRAMVANPKDFHPAHRSAVVVSMLSKIVHKKNHRAVIAHNTQGLGLIEITAHEALGDPLADILGAEAEDTFVALNEAEAANIIIREIERIGAE